MSDSDAFAKPYICQDDAGNDPERLRQLEFHLKTGDYFPMLATVLCALEEGVKACVDGTAHAADLVDHVALRGFRSDLIYLHKHYSIERKND